MKNVTHHFIIHKQQKMEFKLCHVLRDQILFLIVLFINQMQNYVKNAEKVMNCQNQKNCVFCKFLNVNNMNLLLVLEEMNL